MTNPLAAYLDRNGIKPGTFARLAGLQRPTVYRMYKGQSRPSLRMAGIIERATGGAVPLSSWVKPSRAA